MKMRHFPFLMSLLFAAGAMAQTTPEAQSGAYAETQGSLASGMTINATLKGSIDSKKIKPNDTVAAETSDRVKSADGRTILPKGAKLMGHVTQTESRARGDKESMVAVQFDKAMTKDGQEIPLTNVVIQAIAAPASSTMAYSPGPGAGSSTGGTATNNPSMSGSTGGRPGSSTTGSNPSSSYPNTAGETDAGGGAANGPLPTNSQGVYGLQNVKLARANTPNGENSVIISEDKNVRLDSGTRLLLVVQTKGANETPAPGR